MIRIICGGIGSGKSISAIRMIKNRGNKAYTNFSTKKLDTIRMRWKDIINKKPLITNKQGEVTKWDMSVNYEYWRKELQKHPFDMYMDEVQEIVNSRSGQNKEVKTFNLFFSQIRKVLSYNEENDLNCITQRPRSIDVTLRDLAQEWIFCKKQLLPKLITTTMHNGKKIKTPLVLIWQYHFNGDSINSDGITIDEFNMMVKLKLYKIQDCFIANEYYKYYNSYDFVTFGEEDYV